ncbi:hypothetical protein PV327_011496 [Microctonus hyperodae]|uniref:Uncharacterized protein n=1 Tax=Microctonus hyperodae TaxID=165561 RepID=A0AA39C2V4_MICHY|nr:hypothetical protein PV327_011496 [Microctonus hyperodae]
MPKNNKKSVDEYHNERAAVKPPAKTGAQRSREYRARQNALTNVANLCTATQQPSTSVFINNDADNNCVNVYGNRSNTSTQEQAMYSHPSIVVQVDTHQQSTPVLCGEPSTSAVRDGQNITAIARKSTAKTATERSREYRTRIKRAMKDSIEARATLVETVTSAPHKTSAERTRLYRVRMRAKQNTTEPQPTTDTITKQLEANSPPLSGMDDSSELGILTTNLQKNSSITHPHIFAEYAADCGLNWI